MSGAGCVGVGTSGTRPVVTYSLYKEVGGFLCSLVKGQPQRWDCNLPVLVNFGSPRCALERTANAQ